MATDIFTVTESADPVYKLRVTGGTLHVTLEIAGAKGLDYSEATVMLVPQVDYMPYGWTLDGARSFVLQDMCSRRPCGWGAPTELLAAIRDGNARFVMPSVRAA